MLRVVASWGFEGLTDTIQHGIDTAKYYQQAERELEAERSGGSSL